MDSVVEQYKNIRPLYESFTSKLHQLLEELIASSDIEIFIMESRAKSIESFQGKIERDDKNYEDPINEIPDLSGIRIITYYNKDVDSICKLIAKEFDVDEANSVDKRKITEEDRFGYLSSHLIVRLSSIRSQLSEWSYYSSFRTEIQVRSVLQHSWAAIDHKLRYKTEESIPVYLKRKLYRLSALLELADEEFEAIREISGKKVEKIKSDLQLSKLDIAIDRDSFQSYIDNSETFHKFIADIEKIGFSIKELYSDADLAISIRIVRSVNFGTLEDIEKIIKQEMSNGAFYQSLIDDLYGVSPKQMSMSRAALIRLAIIGSASSQKAKKILKGIQFKQKLHELLLVKKTKNTA